jgi:pyruvate/2-oxoglutarate dehydrogenase complex dihydrolipoamide acyltransferase (E2) component
MPKWGVSMQEATLVEWLVQEGVDVGVGDALALIETDKVSTELTSEVAGVLVEHVVAENTVVQVGDIVAVIRETVTS